MLSEWLRRRVSPARNGRRQSRSRMSVAWLAVFACAVLAQAPSGGAAASCSGLGFLSSNGAPGTWSAATSVSADGSVVVGYDIGRGETGYRAFRWTAREGMQPLNLHPDGGIAFESVALRISGDGRVVVGWMKDNKRGPLKAFRWTRETGMEDLGRLAEVHPNVESVATGVSADGAIIVGNNYEAFRWTRDGGLRALGAFLGNLRGSAAESVSADGSTIVGESANPEKYSEAFRWTAGDGIEGLGFLARQGVEPQSRAEAVSGDGAVVVGSSINPDGQSEPFRWTRDKGMQPLGYIGKADSNGGFTRDPRPGFGAKFESSALAVSGDGKTVVGDSISLDGDYQPFIWTEAEGMRNLGTIFGGPSLGEEIGYGGAHGVNADGSIVVGNAPTPARAIEAFLCRVR
jgi:probable HAF family extracellular repeat protein